MLDRNRPWAVGDVAVCIDGARNGGWINSLDGALSAGLVTDQLVHVIAIAADVAFEPAHELGLEFAEFPECLYPASKFRRIEPDAPIAADQAFTQDMRRLRQQVPA